MWFARYFPGLRLRRDDLDAMTPEETAAMRRSGQAILDGEESLRLEHTKGIMRASSASSTRYR